MPGRPQIDRLADSSDFCKGKVIYSTAVVDPGFHKQSANPRFMVKIKKNTFQ